MAQKNGATECILYFKFKDSNFEAELAMNGEPWTLSMVESMDANMRTEYARLLDMKLVENKWSIRPLILLLQMYFVNGQCGVRRIGNGSNASVINKSFYCQYPLHAFNPDFDYQKWQKKHGHKPFKIKKF